MTVHLRYLKVYDHRATAADVTEVASLDELLARKSAR
jgi:hypothetical protein